MDSYEFNKYREIWCKLHKTIDNSLMGESQDTREYVIDSLSEHFDFLEHMYIENVMGNTDYEL